MQRCRAATLALVALANTPYLHAATSLKRWQDPRPAEVSTNDDYEKIARSIGGTAPLSEDGYQLVASLNSNDEMRVFVRRVLHESGRAVLDEGALNGFVPFFSGQIASQNFAAMEQELNDMPWVGTIEEENEAPAEQHVTFSPNATQPSQGPAEQRRATHQQQPQPQEDAATVSPAEPEVQHFPAHDPSSAQGAEAEEQVRGGGQEQMHSDVGERPSDFEVPRHPHPATKQSSISSGGRRNNKKLGRHGAKQLKDGLKLHPKKRPAHKRDQHGKRMRESPRPRQALADNQRRHHEMRTQPGQPHSQRQFLQHPHQQHKNSLEPQRLQHWQNEQPLTRQRQPVAQPVAKVVTATTAAMATSTTRTIETTPLTSTTTPTSTTTTTTQTTTKATTTFRTMTVAARTTATTTTTAMKGKIPSSVRQPHQEQNRDKQQEKHTQQMQHKEDQHHNSKQMPVPHQQPRHPQPMQQQQQMQQHPPPSRQDHPMQQQQHRQHPPTTPHEAQHEQHRQQPPTQQHQSQQPLQQQQQQYRQQPQQHQLQQQPSQLQRQHQPFHRVPHVEVEDDPSLPPWADMDASLVEPAVVDDPQVLVRSHQRQHQPPSAPQKAQHTKETVDNKAASQQRQHQPPSEPQKAQHTKETVDTKVQVRSQQRQHQPPSEPQKAQHTKETLDNKVHADPTPAPQAQRKPTPAASTPVLHQKAWVANLAEEMPRKFAKPLPENNNSSDALAAKNVTGSFVLQEALDKALSLQRDRSMKGDHGNHSINVFMQSLDKALSLQRDRSLKESAWADYKLKSLRKQLLLLALANQRLSSDIKALRLGITVLQKRSEDLKSDQKNMTKELDSLFKRLDASHTVAMQLKKDLESESENSSLAVFSATPALLLQTSSQTERNEVSIPVEKMEPMHTLLASFLNKQMESYIQDKRAQAAFLESYQQGLERHSALFVEQKALNMTKVQLASQYMRVEAHVARQEEHLKKLKKKLLSLRSRLSI